VIAMDKKTEELLLNKLESFDKNTDEAIKEIIHEVRENCGTYGQAYKQLKILYSTILYSRENANKLRQYKFLFEEIEDRLKAEQNDLMLTKIKEIDQEAPVQEQPKININKLRVENGLKPISSGDIDFIPQNL
jgi:hydroxymethylpyrimidine pyrophosphatase-like HAD family hydrolase